MEAFEVARWHAAGPGATPSEFRERSSTLLFLSRFAGDRFVMSSLREALAAESHRSDIFRMSDQEVLEQLAWLLPSWRTEVAASFARSLAPYARAAATTSPSGVSSRTSTAESPQTRRSTAGRSERVPSLATVKKEPEKKLEREPEKKLEGKEPWRLSVCVRSRYPKFPLVGKVKVSIYENQDHSVKTASADVQFTGSDKSGIKAVLTGDAERTCYLAAKGELEREFASVRYEYGKEEWASKEDVEVRMNPGEKQTADIIIDPPQSLEVQGGYFWGYHYAAIDDRKKGAEIVLVFQAKDDQGNDGQTISLVQIVKDTTKLTDPLGDVDITPAPTTSQLRNRQLVLDDAGVQADDVKTGVDQEVLDDHGRKVVNLDFRYSERRLSEADGFNIAGKTANEERTVRSATKKGGTWSAAVLNDQPGPTTGIKGVRYSVRHAVVTGAMEFEVAAFNNDTEEFLGSVRWGWEMQGGHAVLEPPTLAVADAGRATPRFFLAAQKWNATKIVEPSTSHEHDPMQIPIG